MGSARERPAREAGDEQDRDQAEFGTSAVVIGAPSGKRFYPVTPEDRDNAEDAGQRSQRDLDPEQPPLVVPHMPSPIVHCSRSWRPACSPPVVLSRPPSGGGRACRN